MLICLIPTLSIRALIKVKKKTAASASKDSLVFTVGHGFCGVWDVSYNTSLPLDLVARSMILTFTKVQTIIPQFYKDRKSLSVNPQLVQRNICRLNVSVRWKQPREGLRVQRPLLLLWRTGDVGSDSASCTGHRLRTREREREGVHRY